MIPASKALKVAILALALAGSKLPSAFAQAPGVPDALQSYVEIALKQNPDVLAEMSRRDQASARVDQANSNLYPHVDFVSRYTNYTGGRIVSIPGMGQFSTAKLAVAPWDSKFEASWPIFNYAVWEGTRATRAYLSAANYGVSAKELSISYDVSEAYYNYAKASELVAIRKSAEELTKQNLATTNALFNADKAPKNDVLRAEVAVASAHGDVLQAENQQNLARTNFNNLLKRDYDAEIILPKPEVISALVQSSSSDMASNDHLQANTTSFTSDFEQALRARPELEQLKNASVALEGLKSVSRADFFPNVALFASYGWQEDKPKFSNDMDYLAAGVQFQWNIFSGWNTVAKVDENNAQIEELRYQEEAATNGIRIELQNARLERENSRERHEVAIKQLASAEENRRITKSQYDNGMVPLITMIDAETTLANAKANLSVTTYDQLLADAKYRKALGLVK